jgi:hypothetical protein
MVIGSLCSQLSAISFQLVRAAVVIRALLVGYQSGYRLSMPHAAVRKTKG